MMWYNKYSNDIMTLLI